MLARRCAACAATAWRPTALLGCVRTFSAAPSFTLRPSFVAGYASVPPPWGYNGLGEFVYATRYARPLRDRATGAPTGRSEAWFQTIERVVNGTFSMQRRWSEAQGLGWDASAAAANAERMYAAMFAMKFLPPGRGLWAMGSPLTEERGMFAALNNCAFVSTGGVGDGDPS